MIELLDNECNLDNISGLNMMHFFTITYDKYLTSYPDSNLVFIDLTKFKRINDQFTHRGGDACLKSFGNILKSVFSDSLTARKHGDEFLILTKHPYEKIEILLNQMETKIQDHYDLSFIPIVYGFNAGVVPAEHSINSSVEKADIMMYEAKKKNLTYINFSQEAYDKVKKDHSFIQEMGSAVRSDSLNLSQRTIYDINKKPSNIIDLHTRDSKDKSIFTPERLKLLQSSSELNKIDYYNLKKIITSSTIPAGKQTMINIHANSLFNSATPFPRFIRALYNTMNGNPGDYIICININNFNEDIGELTEFITLIKSFGFDIALSGFDLSNHNPLLNIWPHTDAKFIKINPTLWKESQDNNKYMSILKNTIPAFLENGSTPVFMRVEDEEDLDFIRNISEESLIEGNIVDDEKTIKLKQYNFK